MPEFVSNLCLESIVRYLFVWLSALLSLRFHGNFRVQLHNVYLESNQIHVLISNFRFDVCFCVADSPKQIRYVSSIRNIRSLPVHNVFTNDYKADCFKTIRQWRDNGRHVCGRHLLIFWLKNLRFLNPLQPDLASCQSWILTCWPFYYYLNLNHMKCLFCACACWHHEGSQSSCQCMV